MTATGRWCIVALGVAILVSMPFAIDALPAPDSEVGAEELLVTAQQSSDVTYSGLVESRGSLQLPVSNQFTDVADLFGEQTTMRVWWRSADDWRVDQVATTGETDLFHDAAGTTVWDYESNQATRTPNADIRLPQASDLLPPELARRLLEGAHAEEVSRISANRVAGIAAPGLRLVPSDAQSSIGRVDVWVHPDSGLPLRVDVYGLGAKQPALTTTFLDVTLGQPAEDVVAFSPPPSADTGYDDFIDIAAAANAFAPVRPPRSLAGLTKRSASMGAVGVYGRGATLLIALPLWDRAADPLREELAITPGAGRTRLGKALSVGPLNLLLTRTAFEEHSWLFAGTVTPATLEKSARQIKANPPRAGYWVAFGGPR